MATQYDLVIRNGEIVDGSGAPAFVGDIAIMKGVIAKVGVVEGEGAEEIDADGKTVTPGFLDIHTHYDGQATWSSEFKPSTNHGATTVLLGNCGVGFAPCRAEHRAALIEYMEGVEDIPEVVLSAGIPWQWESFPEYLDFLDGRQFNADVITLVPHAPVRIHAMGAKAIDRVPASEDEIAIMRHLVQDAVAAGALGVSTSRTLVHKTLAGVPVPTLEADEAELLGLVMGVRDGGGGMLQLVSDFGDPAADFATLKRILLASRTNLRFSLQQMPNCPDKYRDILRQNAELCRAGIDATALVFPRPIGVLLGFNLSFNPFSTCESFKRIAALPESERYGALSDPEMKKRLLAEFPKAQGVGLVIEGVIRAFDRLFELGREINYLPSPGDSIAARALREGLSPEELAYNLMLTDDGQGILYCPSTNFAEWNEDALYAMLSDAHSIASLGDGGAHVGIICDASMPSYLLSHWVGEGNRRFSLPWAVHELTGKAAETVGLLDRGLLKPGYRADINIIDLDHLRLHRPHVVYDLPTGKRRVDQRAEGYLATLVAGVPVMQNNLSTGQLPGRLIRGRQPRPAVV